MIKAAIVFLISNYSLTFLIVGLIFSGVAIARLGRSPSRSALVEKLIGWHVFWAIGVCYFYNFVMHAFFGELSARFIGWADSPFQFEVATASLGFAVAGFLAAFSNFDRRLVAIVGPSLFTLGAAVGHIHQMVADRNFAPGNAGVIFYMDIIIPIVGIRCCGCRAVSRRFDQSSSMRWARLESARDAAGDAPIAASLKRA